LYNIWRLSDLIQGRKARKTGKSRQDTCSFADAHHLDDALGTDMAEAMMPGVHVGLQCGGRDDAGGEVDGFEAVRTSRPESCRGRRIGCNC
jgi:hypothetical protein